MFSVLDELNDKGLMGLSCSIMDGVDRCESMPVDGSQGEMCRSRSDFRLRSSRTERKAVPLRFL